MEYLMVGHLYILKTKGGPKIEPYVAPYEIALDED